MAVRRAAASEPEEPASGLTDGDRQEISQMVADAVAAAMGGGGAPPADAKPAKGGAPAPDDAAPPKEIERHIERIVTDAVGKIRDSERAEEHDRHHAQLEEAVKEKKAPSHIGRMAKALFGDPS